MDPDGEVWPLPQLAQLVRDEVSYLPVGQVVQLVRESVSSLPSGQVVQLVRDEVSCLPSGQVVQLEEVWLEDDWYWPLLHDTHEPPDTLSPLEHEVGGGGDGLGSQSCLLSHA